MINAAGLYGDHIDQLRGQSNFNILPRKGDYAVFSKEARQYVNHIILPVPNEITKVQFSILSSLPSTPFKLWEAK